MDEDGTSTPVSRCGRRAGILGDRHTLVAGKETQELAHVHISPQGGGLMSLTGLQSNCDKASVLRFQGAPHPACPNIQKPHP